MNCPCQDFDAQKYKGIPYQETPCASCFMTRETHRTNKVAQLYDTDGAQDIDQIAAEQPMPDEDIVPANVPKNIIMNIQKACQENLLVTLSNTILKLTQLSKTYPALFQILTIKMQYPYMSYYEIGQVMIPPCSKQNVLYHLSHAVQQFPELSNAILTDTRFSGGRYAIKTVADKVYQEKHTDKVKKLLYAETEANKRKSIAELQKLFAQPYRQETVDLYDAYAKKEASDAKD